MKLADYNNCLVNLSNSFLKKYNCETFHPTIKEVDELIKNHQKIVVILMDGMGTYPLEVHNDVAKTFNAHKFKQITSVFPPTTVAATTSFLTGLYPGENGYLGWSQPINNFTRNINVFSNVDTQTEEKIEGENIINKLCPTVKITKLINDANNKTIAYDIYRYPVDKDGPKSFPAFLRRIKKTSKNKDEFFIYGYFNNPDHTMHEFGVSHKKVKTKIKKYTSQIVKFANKNKDALILVIADHGLIDIKPLYMDEHSDLNQLLSYAFFLEIRCPSFKVKEGKHDLFKQLFNKYYGQHFQLYTFDEVEKNHIFTDGKLSERSKQFIGDFVAIAKDEYALIFDNNAPFKAHHAGSSKMEMDINITVFNEVRK